METSAYKLFALNLLIEGDFQAKSTKSGKTVDYKSKEARDDAIKAGDAVELDKDKQDKDTEEPTGKLGGGDFERETEPERGEPEGGAGDSDAAKAAIDRGEYGQHDPSTGDKPKAKRSDRYKDVDTSWHDDPEASAAQDWGQSGGMWPGQSQDKPKSEYFTVILLVSLLFIIISIMTLLSDIF